MLIWEDYGIHIENESHILMWTNSFPRNLCYPLDDVMKFMLTCYVICTIHTGVTK